MLKRTRSSHRKPQGKEVGDLIRLAEHLARSSCCIEDRFWEKRLGEAIALLLHDRDEASISSALDQLHVQNPDAFGALIDTIEASAESLVAPVDIPQEGVLFAVPILAWSRFQIPVGPISQEHLATIRVHLQAHILAKDAKLCLVNHLFSPDQLPQSYCETWELTEALLKPALHGRDHPADQQSMADTAHFLSDNRYLLGAVVCAPGAALFRWQEDDAGRDDAIRQWQVQGYAALRPLFPACAIELIAPSAYHSAIREADRASRPYSIKAGIDFLCTVLNRKPGDFQATIGAYYNRQLEEYRIGFSVHNAADIVHGVIWPLLDASDEKPETPQEIEALLRASGISNVCVLNEQLPMEYCDDCGAPLFPNPDGESTHAELPEDVDTSLPSHLH